MEGPIEDMDIEMNEVPQDIKKMKNSRASVPCGVCIEMVKALDEGALSTWKLISDIWNEERSRMNG